MNKYIKILVSTLLTSAIASIASAVEITGITTVTSIDPTGGATVKHANPAFSTNFSAASGSVFTATSKAEMESFSNLRVLNFESANGFGTASQTLDTDGKIFSGTGIAPFTEEDRITKITTIDGISIGVENRVFDRSTGVLGDASANRSVFLIGDRTANDTMLSGTQGLTVGSTNGVWRQGIYLTFDQNLSSFSYTANAVSSGATHIVAFFNEAGSVIGTYFIGVAISSPIYFGATSATSDIRSVWIGQSDATNGLIIDDIAFVTAIPEPTVMALLMGGMVFAVLTAIRFRRRAK